MKNELNAFTNGYMPWYPRFWWHNIQHFFITLKRAWQRATRGYSDRDLWNLDAYYDYLLIASLSTFRRKTIGYPGYMDSIEEWYAILDKIIMLLKQASEMESLEEKNEFAEWYEEYLNTKNFSMTEVDGGARLTSIQRDADAEAKINMYYTREKELYQIRTQKRKEAFELLAEYFGHLWW